MCLRMASLHGRVGSINGWQQLSEKQHNGDWLLQPYLEGQKERGSLWARCCQLWSWSVCSGVGRGSGGTNNIKVLPTVAHCNPNLPEEAVGLRRKSICEPEQIPWHLLTSSSSSEAFYEDISDHVFIVPSREIKSKCYYEDIFVLIYSVLNELKCIHPEKCLVGNTLTLL